MRSVAWLTGASWREGPIPEGALPGPDAQDYVLLASAAAERGLSLEIARWASPDLPDQGFAAALVRSTWDYQDNLEEFLAALERFERAGAPVFNPSSVVRWNARKTYLEDLSAKGAPIIPTHWADRVDVAAVLRAFETFDTVELVVKPQLGAGSRNTIRLRRNAWSEADLALAPPGAVMIQPFLPSIEAEGEVSLFYFGGRPAHVIRKRPAEGGWLANVNGARFAKGEATAAERRVAEAVLAAAPADMLYARVDLVAGPDGAPRLIELEAIEPYFFLTFAPEAAPLIAEVLDAAVGGVLSP